MKAKMRNGVPVRSRRNLAGGMFTAGSLGDAVRASGSRPVNLEVAKVNIRRQRRILSGEFQKAEAEAEQAKKKLRAAKAWWRTRRSWKTIRVGNRIGKINPRLSSYRERFVEFPNGDSGWRTIVSTS